MSGGPVKGTGIRHLVLDIDGVLTDGTTPLSAAGEKRLFLRDLDALTAARRAGLTIGFLSGEPDIDHVVQRCGGGPAIAGAKDKSAGLIEIARLMGVAVDEICYVGDADRDAPALDLAGLGLAPSDASHAAVKAANRVLRNAGGRGAVAEAVELLLRVPAPSELAGSLDRALQAAVADLGNSLDELEGMAGELGSITDTLANGLMRRSKVLLFGNGGSAAMAQHAAAELVGRFRSESDPLPAMALSTDTSVVTALANDYGYDEVFARQIRAHGRPGDVAVGFSTSGTSGNVVRGLGAARTLRLATVGFTGRDGRSMKGLCDSILEAPSTQVPRVQELHLAAWHIICEALESCRSPSGTVEAEG